MHTTTQDMSLFDGGNFDPAARSSSRYLPVESPMPGTTLGIIPLQAFVSGGTLFGEYWVVRLPPGFRVRCDAF
jgi:hypothetical protein